MFREEMKFELRDFHCLTLVQYINDAIRKNDNVISFKHNNILYRITKTPFDTFYVEKTAINENRL